MFSYYTWTQTWLVGRLKFESPSGLEDTYNGGQYILGTSTRVAQTLTGRQALILMVTRRYETVTSWLKSSKDLDGSGTTDVTFDNIRLNRDGATQTQWMA